uniref:RNA polymerase sigma factor n=1 Tax=Pedobacter schmidteae TaxID=2201271 RepID=UPI000EAFE2E8|nr:RNA polymerase sigma-70 factor [Pedobacter schmidteae]
MISVNIENDPTLLPDFRAGRERAFDQIFRHFYPALCLFAQRLLPAQANAKDIAQDALLKAWERKSDFEGLGKLKSFLFTCVRNACFNEFEKNKVQLKYHAARQNPEFDDEQGVLEQLIHAEVVTRIFAQVDRLPEQCRKVIRMTFEEGKKPKEIAEELGISISNVSSQKLRGLQLLKDKLSDKDFLTAVVLIVPGLWH